MTLWPDLEDEMQRLPIDVDTADRLLAGSVSPADAPPGYERVALLMTTIPDCPAPTEERAAEIVAAMATAVRSSRTEITKTPRRSSVHRIKLASALAAAALAATTSLAFAGSLPGAAQDVASAMLAKVGVSVPGPNENAGDHPNTSGKSSEHVTTSSSGKGAEISELATSTALTGVDKGAAISTLASGGQSQAGQHGQAGEHGAPVEAPNEGGTGTANTASGGNSSAGTGTADTASDGHSSAGSANSDAGQSHRP